MSRPSHRVHVGRIPLRVLAAAVLALSLMASVSPAQAAGHRAPSKLTATLGAATLLPHSSTLLSGDVTPRGTGVVVLQRYVKGKWVQVSHKSAGKTGHYYFPLKTSAVLGTSIYRVLRGGSSKATGVISKNVHLRTVKTAFQLAAATRPAVASGAPVVVTGTVAHKATGFVMLEMLQHGVWKSMWTGRLSAKSTFSFSHVLATGKYALRIRKPATATIASGVSKAVKVTVAAAPLPPTASITLSGHLVTAGVYSGPVTATVTTLAPANVASLTYALDGAAAKPYTAPVVVNTVGTHHLVVKVTDGRGRTGGATSTWTTSSLQSQPVLPTAVINLAGTPSTGTSFIGAVTATIVASDAGGPGVASVAYTFDSTSSIPYAGGPIASPGFGPHTISVTVTDTAGNIGTATRSWSQLTKADVTKPTGTIALTGTLSGSTYKGAVSVTLSGNDTGSGVADISYNLDGAGAADYSAPFSVAAPGSHTVVETVTDYSGNVGTATKTWSQIAVVGGSSDLVVSSADQSTLGLPTARLVYSTNQNNSNPVPAKQFTVTNATSTKTIAVTSLSIGGTNPGSYHLAAGQATSFSLPPGASALVSVVFQPSAPTNCPGALGGPTDTLIGNNVVQTATLTYTTNDGSQPSGSADLSGLNACFEGGNSEPVLDQVVAGLGYATVVDNSVTGRRFIGPLRYLPGSDEVQAPYFTRANASAPVSIVPIAHYATGSNQTGGYQATGYYPQGTTMALPNSSCTAACITLFNFPNDPSPTTYNQNQKLLPIPVGTTTFNPTGSFGIFSGDYSNVNFTDDGLNVGHKNDGSNSPLPVPHYLHDIRVFQAYAPGHVAIPNTYLLGEDINRVPGYKNDDFQDVVYLVSNVTPTAPQGPVLSGSNSVDLTAGGTVNGCSVSGFDGILGGCVPGNLHFSGSGLSITSTAGQLGNNNQDNAVYKSFDATRSAFTVTARVVGGINQLTDNYQQLGAFFGSDQNNFVKIEIEHNGAGAPHMTMYLRQNGGAGQSVTTIQPAGLTSASTVDLVIKANGDLPDPLPFGDTYGVSGFPLDPVAVYYSIDGGPLNQIGNTLYPADVAGLFSRNAKAGILDSNSGTSTSLTATFSRFTLASG